MARESIPYTETNPMAGEIDLTEPHAITRKEVDDLQAVQMEMQRNTESLARELGYDGELTVGAIEDRIRLAQRRTVEEVLELGKCLLLLKTITAHGEFVRRIELLGFGIRMAQRFISATTKFSKSVSKSLLHAAGGQTKLLELLVLDEDEINEISIGGTVRGLDLDDVSTMSVTELRAALRQARAKAVEAEGVKQAQLQAKERLINSYEEQLHLHLNKPIEVRGREAIEEIEKTARKLASQCTVEMCRGIKKITDAMDGGYPTNSAREAILSAFHTVMAGLRDAAYEHGFLAHLDGLFPKELEEP